MFEEAIYQVVVARYLESGRTDKIIYKSEIKRAIEELRAFVAENNPEVIVSPMLFQDVLNLFRRAGIYTVDMER